MSTQELLGFDPHDPFVQRAYRAGLFVSRFFDTRLIGANLIPSQGGVMVVGNHALMGVDAWALIPELARQTGRIPRGMGLRALFDVPVLGRTLSNLGVVSGDRDSAIALLRGGKMVLTYPGGAKDSLKGTQQRHRLQWGDRRGFAHAAICAQTPVVPVVGVGPDDCFAHMSGRGLLPTRGLGSSLKLPLFLPVLKRVPFDFHVGAPIAPPAFDPQEMRGDHFEQAVATFASQVREATQSLLDTAGLWRDRVGSSRFMK